MLKELDNRFEVCYIFNNQIDYTHIHACNQ